MTYLKPHCKKNLLNRIIGGLVLGILGSTFYLVAVYNNVVNVSHNIATAKAQLDAIGAKNATLNNQVVASLGNIQSNSLAEQDGLVTDNHPQYFSFNNQPASQLGNQSPTSQSWPIASEQ